VLALAGLLFFAPAASVAAQDVAGEGAAYDRAARFPDILHADVDRFWAEQFALAERAYAPPAGVVAIEGPLVTGCGRADPATAAAFYCVLDETIYYAADFRAALETIGDFGWIVVVAHEWAHHVQFQLGIDLGPMVGQSREVGDLAPIQLEQQADCLAGAYTQDAEGNGWLDPGDVEEAIAVTELAGDPVGTPFNDPFAHGSSAARVAAYVDGYEGGIEACGLEL
jgi:predicted metalloprotease